VSRRHQLMRTPLTAVALIIACSAAVLGLAGCGAGQVTQTDSQVAVIDGTEGNVGNIALRDVLIPYPAVGSQAFLAGSYPVGSDVPLHFVIVNQGARADELLSVTTPMARQVQLAGSTTIPAGVSITSADGGSLASDGSLASSQPSASPAPSAQPATPLDFGELSIVLVDVNRTLSPGLNTEITFVFRDAGRVTLPVPLGGPPPGDERKPLGESSEHS